MKRQKRKAKTLDFDSHNPWNLLWEALAIDTQLRKSVHSISESERPEGKQNMYFQAEGQHARQAHFKHRILYMLIFYAASSATNKITMCSKRKATVSKASLLEASAESPCYLQSVCNCFLWPSLPVFKSGKGYTYLSLFKKGEKEDLRNQSFTRLILRSIQILEKIKQWINIQSEFILRWESWFNR